MMPGLAASVQIFLFQTHLTALAYSVTDKTNFILLELSPQVWQVSLWLTRLEDILA